MALIIYIPSGSSTDQQADRRAKVDQLKQHGWTEVPTSREEPAFIHPGIQTELQARLHLRRIGCNPDDFSFERDPDDRQPS